MQRKKTIAWGDPKVNRRDAAAAISGLEYLRAVKDAKNRLIAHGISTCSIFKVSIT